MVFHQSNAIQIGADAIDMEVNKGLLAFSAEEEVAVGVVVHEEVFGEDGRAVGVAVWGGAQRRTKLTDEQVPLPLSAQTIGTIIAGISAI